MASQSAPLVLLVDDEPDQVEMYQVALEISGFDVIVAFRGEEAISLARARVPDAVVLDIRLPDISGWEVCRTLKSDTATRGIPVIVLTAAATSTLPQQSRAAGCATYLVKPCFPDLLTRTVWDVIGGRTTKPEV